MRTVRTTCPYCGVGCGIDATVKGERAVSIAGDKEHPANLGRLCSKGTHLAETVSLEGRLLYPMIADRQVSWDEALGEVASRISACVREHGPESVAFYVSGQLLTEDYYVANKLAKGFIGTPHIDTNSRLCMASAVVAHNRAFGEDVVPCGYEDIDCADLILLVGSNTAWCHPVIWQRIEQARERRGARLVVIDPRRTETAERADLHIPVEPDGDIALLNALLAEMRDCRLLDRDFLGRNVEVPEGFWDGLDAGASGIEPSLFGQLASLVAAHPRMITLFSQGANQSVCGTDKGNAIINLHLATGRINHHGAGPFSITGQPNAMGGREVGGLASTLACHLGFSEAERADVARFWHTESLCSGPGLKAVDMFRAIDEGQVRFLWVIATNPAVSMPDAGFVRAALAKCPTVVVSDMIADTDTGRFAHIRLPALGWGEKDGTVTNSERRISRQRPLFAPPGEARADWRILCDVARKMGFGEAFAFSSPGDIFREYAAMTGLAARHGKVLDLTQWAGCTPQDYERMRPFQWGGAHPLRARFPTGDGRARMVCVDAPPPRAVDPAWPLRLNTGRYRDQWHTMTRTGLSPKLSLHRREPLLEIHPEDAGLHGLADGGFARVATAQGPAVYRVALSDAQQRGQIFTPMHWTDVMGSGGRTGRLAQPLHDPHSGQPGFKDTPACVEAIRPEWRAFLATGEIVVPQALYWSRARVEGGWLYELAGDGTVDIEQILPEGRRSEVADLARGMRRIAVSDADGRLRAALFVTRSGELPSRDWIAGQLGSDLAGLGEWLAGRPAQAPADTGPVVCVCFGVGEQQLLAALSDGAATVAEVGKATCAGTNCGSCRPLIARLIEEAQTTLQEAAQ
ncbi:nitrate reductase [Tsuneonella sp. CC-YZS046]|uniref:nitrate reductase n=1 Tax=Tsuneonella sp. CC-YZS046 TaxID=3042152 RepID=UPI002D789851|nr:nitrate reductase [Tsuneonella sp. CC-YZS046]WRO65250.1 nitrate reductase [Tsuneonella sp. CC-YZS046]